MLRTRGRYIGVGPLLSLLIAGMSHIPAQHAQYQESLCADMNHVAGDMVRLGIAQMPSTMEIATLIHGMNKGALRGLKWLGLLSEVYVGVEDVHTALLTWMEWVQSSIPPVALEEMRWDVLTAENSLCKIYRLIPVLEGTAHI